MVKRIPVSIDSATVERVDACAEKLRQPGVNTSRNSVLRALIHDALPRFEARLKRGQRVKTRTAKGALKG